MRIGETARSVRTALESAALDADIPQRPSLEGDVPLTAPHSRGATETGL
jgi:hypothetical protein